jgi:hypothetical protein
VRLQAAPTLLPGLDATDTIIVGEVLRVLLGAASAPEKAQADEPDGITLDQLIAILAGDRAPDLAGLPPDVAAKVKGMIAGL